MARLAIELSSSEHQLIKTMAAAEGVTIKDLMLDLFRKKYTGAATEKRFNKLTRQVVEAADNGRNITVHKNIGAMFSHLDAK